MAAPFFGGPASFGPFGNAGPSTASASTPFSFSTGEVAWGTPTQAQSAISALTIAAVAAAFVGTIWLLKRK